METRHVAAALLLPLVLTTPAGAQGPVGARGEIRTSFGPPYLPALQAPTSRLPLKGAGSGFSLSAIPAVQTDGSAVKRQALVGSWAMAPAVKVGVGLIKVIRTSPKAGALGRVRLTSDAGGRTDRIAAVGLSVSF